MGAEFNYHEFKGKTKTEVLNEAKDLIEECLHDYGHAGYTGSFAECDGVVFVNNFAPKDSQEADEWLQDNANKWGPMLILMDNNHNYYGGAWCSS